MLNFWQKQSLEWFKTQLKFCKQIKMAKGERTSYGKTPITSASAVRILPINNMKAMQNPPYTLRILLRIVRWIHPYIWHGPFL